MSLRSGLRPACLPILMYHSVSDSQEDRSAYYKLCTSADRFRAQMHWLELAGFQGVTLRDGLAHLARGACTDRKPAVITFDDGFADFYRTAHPILQEHGFTATVYLPTGYIADSRRTFKSHDCMTWAEVIATARMGIEFGSHTVTHPVLHRLAWKEIRGELDKSKLRIEDALGRSVDSFAYPYSYPQADRSFTARFTELLREIPYKNSVTTMVGRVARRDDPFQLKRLPVNQDDDCAFFHAKLSGAYDWFGWTQLFRKEFRFRFQSIAMPASPS